VTVTGDFSIFTGVNMTVGAGAELRLGSGLVNYDAEILCNTSITIGDGCWIGPRVVIRDDDEHELDGSIQTAPIVIGDNVWIGGQVTILKGVAIGDGAVIAAGAIVTKNVPPRALVAGVPARVMRENVSWRP
jgi:acetyltransferase-like isoleucine patch superfamily enzyme